MKYLQWTEHHRSEHKHGDFLLLYMVLVVKFYLQYYFVSIPKELKKEITRTLTADNPHIPQGIVRFSFKVSVTHKVRYDP